MNIYQKVFRELNKAKIKYIVVGGVAVNLHGYPRMTGDLDIVIALDEKNLDQLDKVMKRLNYFPRIPVDLKELSDKVVLKKLVEEKGMKAYTLNPSGDEILQIDIIIEESLNFVGVFARHVEKIINDTVIPVIHIDDLLKMKSNSDRRRDLEDLEALLKLKGL